MADVIDAVIVGSGPNGLAAAIVLAEARRHVVVFEARATVGGGTSSEGLTLPGFVHDVCSAIHPFAVASPLFRRLPLDRLGLEWIEPPAMLAHPFDREAPALLYRSLERTAAALGDDGPRYVDLMRPVLDDWEKLERAILGPITWPHHPVALGRFGLTALRSAASVARGRFATDRARALFAGLAGHGMLPLDKPLTAGFGLVLGALSHRVGWVLPKGGSQRLADALAKHLLSLGGEIRTSSPVTTLDELPPATAILCDLSPRPFLRIAGSRLPPAYRRKLEVYRYGMGVFKVDWALDHPIPWRNAECSQAPTVHLGGSFAEVLASEQDAWNGRHSEKPFVLLVQPTLFDASRAPAGKHTAWAYCHVPHGSRFDMLPAIEAQIERFAPGFSKTIAARHVLTPEGIEARNPNFVGGDIASGAADLSQFFARPTLSAYSTPVKGLYLCSAATPPGVGVHGMCGYYAARRALRDLF